MPIVALTPVPCEIDDTTFHLDLQAETLLLIEILSLDSFLRTVID